MNKILEQLNPAQKQAVTSHSKYLLILAGAGSGKTGVLVKRIAWLIEQGLANSNNILAVTFTNKAANEMRNRVQVLLGEQESKGVWLGTFHGINHKMLRIHHQEVGLNPAFQILDSDDQKRLIKRTMIELDIDTKINDPKDVQSYINKHKEQAIRAKDAEGGNPFFNSAANVYLRYEAICRRDSLVDFAEIILCVLELLEKNQQIREQYQKRFRHILIDEFQDTNDMQYRWLKVMAGTDVDVTVVGDDDQSIYGWRGAKIANIRDFGQHFSGCKTIKLEQNYRSTGHILTLANAVIKNNPERLGKNLWTDSKDGDKVQVLAAYNDQEEASFVCETTKKLTDDGFSLNDIAILYRSNALSRALEEKLIQHRIAYRIFGGHKFYDRMEIKNALAYFRLINNSHDNTSIERVINVPARGIGKQTLDSIRLYAKEQDCSLWKAAQHLCETDNLTARGKKALSAFIACIDSLKMQWQDIIADEDNGDMLADFSKNVLKDSGMLAMYSQDKDNKDHTMRLDNLEELINACHEYGGFRGDGLSEFLSNAALDAGDMQAEEGEACVSLMTVHSSKGLEYKAVFLVGMEDGLFPHEMSLGRESLEEERRLCYVAVTRAMNNLYISHCESRLMHGKTRYNRISRFLSEMPASSLDYIKSQQKTNKLEPIFDEGDSTPKEIQGFTIGTNVVHPAFGDGSIIGMEGSGEHLRLNIKFPNINTNKWILASFSKLIVH